MSVINKYLWIIILFISLLNVDKTLAADTDFWFAVPHLDNGHSAGHSGIMAYFDRPVYFIITADDKPATVTLEMPAYLHSPLRIISLNAYESKLIKFGENIVAFGNAQMDTIQNDIRTAGIVDVKHNRGIHITSTAPVTVTYQVDSYYSKDMYALKGSNALGHEFYTPFQDVYTTVVSSYPYAYPQFHIVATEDGTTVKITPKGDIVGTVAGTTKTVILNKGETFAARSVSPTPTATQRLGGSYIWSDKPVAVTVTDDLLNTGGGADVTGDQLVPVEKLGTTYSVIRGYTTGSYGDYVYVVGTTANTTVRINGTVVTTTLGAGNTYRFLMNTATPVSSIEADKPVYAYQLSGIGGELAAASLPSMYSINAKRVVYYSSVASGSLFVLTRTGNEKYFKVNGNSAVLTSADFIAVPNLSGWVYARKSITSTVGVNVVENTKGPFSLGYFYGTGSASFGYLSDYGYLSLPDTLYQCPGDTLIIDAGYALSYNWVLPDGSTATTSSVKVKDSGWYKVTVNQDPHISTDSVYVIKRLENVKLQGPDDLTTGVLHHFSIDWVGENKEHITVTWHADYATLLNATKDAADFIWLNDDPKWITAEISDSISGCKKIVSKFIQRNNCHTTGSLSSGLLLKLDKQIGNTLSQYSPVIAGDLDGDGKPEFVAMHYTGYSNTWGWYTNTLYIYKYDGTLLNKITIPNTSMTGNVSMGRVKQADGSYESLLFVAAGDGYLYAYQPGGTTYFWKSDVKFIGTIGHYTQALGFADMDGDGYAELYINNRIFDAATGKFICAPPVAANEGFSHTYVYAASSYAFLSLTSVGDIDNDGKLELLSGTQAWNVNITRSLSDPLTTFSGSMSLAQEVASPHGVTSYPNDGNTQVLDLDGDGYLDVLVSLANGGTGSSATLIYMYVWSPHKGTVLANVTVPTVSYAKNVPAIGDIDGDGKPEIIIGGGFSGSNAKLHAYKYNGSALVKFWEYIVVDGSYACPVSLFDFDNDGKDEIVHRGDNVIQLIDGSTSSPSVISSLPCVSATVLEYPVIVDADGDGSAEIVVTGGATNNASSINVYKPVSGRWAATGTVWNQYGYNGTLVNKDLTIRSNPVNPGTAFPGPDGNPGTADDMYPYNGYMRQTGVLNTNGIPLNILPNAEINHRPRLDYNALYDSLTIRVQVDNTGNLGFAAPFKISVYNTSSGKTLTKEFNSVIQADSSVVFLIEIPDFQAEWLPLESVLIRINDGGDGSNDQLVCDASKREYRFKSIIAVDDRVLLYENRTDNVIRVADNDLLPLGCSHPVVQILNNPSYSGTATVNGSVIEYTPPSGYIRMDTLRYRIHCGDPSKADTATVYINIIEQLDNISDSECYTDPPATNFDIKLLHTSNITVSNWGGALVGDIDGGGDIEILVQGAYYNTTYSHFSNAIHVFRSDATLKYSISTPPFSNCATPFSIANVDGNGYAAIFLTTSAGLPATPASDKRQLIKYIFNGTTYVESWRRQYSANANYDLGLPVIADFDNDGLAEIQVYDKIFCAKNGTLLADGGYLGTSGTSIYGFGKGAHSSVYTAAIKSSFMIPVDIDGDGTLEVAAGDCVYSVKIDRAVPSNGEFKFLRRAASRIDVGEGATAVADMDLDGLPDVVVTRSNNTIGSVFIWNPRTGELMNDNIIQDIPVYTSSPFYGPSVPFIGDLDGDGFPEIALTGRLVMRAYEYDASTKQISQKWSVATTDVSAGTTMSLFDFNQDKSMELVYRDQNHLRIVKGTDGSNLRTFTCTSPTSSEYPVVADVNGDGRAEIVVTGNGSTAGYLYIYGNSDWAPARKVWNQFSYNSINVNEDLTIPKYPLNPATVFPGYDGMLGTTDDVRPYNNFLQQQTFLNMYGTPIWLIPNGQIAGTPTFVYDIHGDSVTVTIDVHNAGDAAFQAPFNITVYKDNIGGSLKYTYAYNQPILQGTTASITFAIRDFKAGGWHPYEDLAIQINDNGNGFNHQMVCDSAVRNVKTTNLFACDDRYFVLENSGNNEFNVTFNDLRSVTCTHPIVTLIENPGNGSVGSIKQDTLVVYTPNTGYTGPDTLKYEIACGGKKDTAFVYITVLPKGDEIIDTECIDDANRSTFELKLHKTMGSGLTDWAPIVAGDLDGDGKPEFISPVYTSHNWTANNYYGYYAKTLNIQKGNGENTTLSLASTGAAMSGTITLGKVKVGSDYKSLIFVAEVDKKIRAYELDGTVPYWTSTDDYATQYTATSGHIFPTQVPGLADFDGDGITELYIGNKIFDAATGKRMGITNTAVTANQGYSYVYGTGTYHNNAIVSVADVDNDGKPELLIGNEAWRVEIDRSVPASPTVTLTLLVSVTPPAGMEADGNTQVLDFDGDGYTDVLVSRNYAGAAIINTYVWSPVKKTVLAYRTVATAAYHKSLPGIGDIDGDGKPEIIISGNQMHAFKYDGTINMKECWLFVHGDATRSTAVSLFDLNNDGTDEIIYRNSTTLRILDGSGTAPVVKGTLSNLSGTVIEYPLVLDADGDGSAEIVIMNNASANNYLASIGIFKPTSGRWAPTRNVWNRYVYNGLHVNDDLTTRVNPPSPSMVMPGADGIYGTDDDVQPYNGSSRQIARINSNGIAMNLLPKAEIFEKPVCTYDPSGDSLTIRITVENNGEIGFESPFYVTAYKNVAGGLLKSTHRYEQIIMAGETTTITFGIGNFKADWHPFDHIVIQVNDKGDGWNDQAVCDSVNRIYRTGNVIASDDRFLVYENQPDNPLHVTVNDLLPEGCVPRVQLLTPPVPAGSALVQALPGDSVLLYTPPTDFTGYDTLRYRVYCDADPTKIDTAMVYVNIIRQPDNISDADCYVTPPGSAFSIKQLAISNAAEVVYASGTPLVGDIDNDGLIEIVVAGGVYPNGYKSTVLRIFEVKDNQIIQQQALTTPAMVSGYATPFCLANVDGNGYSAIFLCTSNTGNVTANQRQLIKYVFNGTSYVEERRVTYSAIAARQGGIPSVVDFNGDGRAEIVVFDKVFDAQTLTLLADGQLLSNTTMGFGRGAFPVDNEYASYMAVGDMDGDGIPEVAAGNCVYKVNISNPTGITGNSFELWSTCDGTDFMDNSHKEVGDGCTAIADIDGDGMLDVIVTVLGSVNGSSNSGAVYVWNPRTKKVIHKNIINTIAVPNTTQGPSAPFVGDIDNDGAAEICLTSNKKMYAYEYNPATKELQLLWEQTTSDASSCTTMSMFDFNQDGSAELVYRDETHLRIIDGKTGKNLRDKNNQETVFSIVSGTVNEYPIVADVNNDGAAEIIVTGSSNSSYANGRLWIFSSNPAGAWAPARKVWNQFGYNAVNINDDLTVPAVPLNPATVFPGEDGLVGTSDDVRPYNGYLMQQTVLNKSGMPIWITPDASYDASVSYAILTDDSVKVTVGILNRGDAAIGPPVYISLYKDDTLAVNRIKTDSAYIVINPGETGSVSISVDTTTINTLKPINIVVRINDKNGMYPYQSECDTENNVIEFLNPALTLLMKKDATLNAISHNGTYANPVSVLHGEDIEYKIEAVNANLQSGTSDIIIMDTLPAYLYYVSNSSVPAITPTIISGTPPREVLRWTIPATSMETKTVSFKATPGNGICACQPLFVNRAWVTVSDTVTVPTNNSTYHQGAGVSMVTFSAGSGGSIYNAEPQAVDYRSSVAAPILIVPNEGFRFTGWRHEPYISMRGMIIEGREGIMNYDTLIIYGNVELQANFEPDEYLEDILTEQGNEIPEETGEDKIWAVQDELYIRTSEPESVVRIYSIEGVLQKVHTILQAGEAKIKLSKGLYVVTLNNGIGWKVAIE